MRAVMIRGFDRDNCRMTEPPVRGWCCHTCHEWNEAEVGEPKDQTCFWCGSLKSFGGKRGETGAHRGGWRVRG